MARGYSARPLWFVGAIVQYPYVTVVTRQKIVQAHTCAYILNGDGIGLFNGLDKDGKLRALAEWHVLKDLFWRASFEIGVAEH